MNNLKNFKILIVDDEPDFSELVSLQLSNFGTNIETASSVSEAFQKLRINKYQLILSDLRMREGGGMRILDAIYEEKLNFIPFILLSGFDDISLEEAYANGVHSIFSKPFQIGELINRIHFELQEMEKKIFCNYDIKKIHIKNHFKNWQDLKLGRGGFCHFIPISEKPHLGDIISFEFNFESIKKVLKGNGMIRWIKGNGSDTILIGVEWICFSESEYLYFIEEVKKLATMTKSFIANK